MTEEIFDNPNDFGSSCCRFYENDFIQFLLGESLHPGGLALTKELGKKLKLSSHDEVLDLASGLGTTALFLAEEFGSSVTGIDWSEKNVKTANTLAEKRRPDNKVRFQVGNAEKLPFEDHSFDVVISECSFCLFQNKSAAAQEMFRVLKPNGGRVGITDVAIEKKLPIEMEKMIFKVACIQDALSMKGYRQELEQAGFKVDIEENRTDTIYEMISEIKKKIFVAELAIGIKKLNLRKSDLQPAKIWLKKGKELVDAGYGTYVLIVGSKS